MVAARSESGVCGVGESSVETAVGRSLELVGVCVVGESSVGGKSPVHADLAGGLERGDPISVAEVHVWLEREQPCHLLCITLPRRHR